MGITQRKDIIAVILVIILAFLIGYNRIYKHNLNIIDSIKSQIDEEKKKNEILGIVDVLDKRLEVYQKRSFATTEITQILDKISDLAEETHIKLETFNPLPAIYREEYIELSLMTPLRAEYHKLGEFLSLIESNQEFIWVKELNMQKPTVIDPGKSRIPKIDLTVSGLYLKK